MQVCLCLYGYLYTFTERARERAREREREIWAESSFKISINPNIELNIFEIWP